MDLLSRTTSPNKAFFNPDFMSMLEDHLLVLKNKPDTRTIAVEPWVSERYRGDFYGLLQSLGVTQEYHYVNLRLNDLTSPITFDGTLTQIVLASESDIVQLKNIFQVKK